MPEIYHYLQQLVNGLTVGSTYALIAIGYTMVYGIIGMINFAHGEVYMISAYLSAVGLALLARKNTVDWPGTMAGAVVTALPMVLVFLVAQRKFIEGLTAGSTKG